MVVKTHEYFEVNLVVTKDVHIGVNRFGNIGVNIGVNVGVKMGVNMGINMGINMSVHMGVIISEKISENKGVNIDVNMGIQMSVNFGLDMGVNLVVDLKHKGFTLYFDSISSTRKKWDRRTDRVTTSLLELLITA